MVAIFSKYHQAKALSRIKNNIRREKLIKDRNKLEGVFLMLDELKIHLKKFDKALERMYKEKSDRTDFEMLK